MKYAEGAENVRPLLDDMPSQDKFTYELLLADGTPKVSFNTFPIPDFTERENHSGKLIAQLMRSISQ